MEKKSPPETEEDKKQTRWEVWKGMQKKKKKIQTSYPFIIQILQRFLPRALPDLHLPRLGDVGLPVDDSPVAPAPARRQRVKVQCLAVRRAFHRAEHATEFLPRPSGAVGAHALEEGWHFPGTRHALPRNSSADADFLLLLCLLLLGQAPPLTGSKRRRTQWKRTKTNNAAWKHFQCGERSAPWIHW